MQMKTALVTGAGNGIGAAIAQRLAREGYRIAAIDTDIESAKVRARALPDAVAYATDVTDERAVETMLDALGDVPDVLVNNAGIVRFGPLLEHSVADFRKVIDVNLVGTFIMSRAVGRRMLARRSGAIVNITSINAVVPSPDAGAYPASKAGVALLTQHFALVLGPHGIRVNARLHRRRHGSCDLCRSRSACIAKPERPGGIARDGRRRCRSGRVSGVRQSPLYDRASTDGRWRNLVQPEESPAAQTAAGAHVIGRQSALRIAEI